MKVTIEHKDGLTCQVRVQLPASQVDELVAERLRELGATLKLKGFRQGKIPPRVLRERYGSDTRRQVVDEAVQKACRDAMQREDLEAAGAVHVNPQETRAGEDLTYVATVEIFPAYTVTGTESLKVNRPVVEIGAADVDELIERLRKQSRSWTRADRPARRGDRLLLDIDASVADGPDAARRAVPVVLGEDDVDVDTAESLIGLSVGDVLDRELRYPPDIDAPVAGRTVRYRVVVRGVAEENLPDVDRDFCRQFGIPGGEPAALRALAEADLKREAALQVQTDVKLQLLGQLIDKNPLNLPVVLVEEEAGRLRRQALEHEGIEDASAAPPPDAFRAAAERNVHMGLMVRGVFREHGLQVLREEINDRIAESCPPGEDPITLQDRYYRNPGLLSQVEDAVMDDKVVDWLMRQATVSETPMSFLDLLARRAPESAPRADLLLSIFN